MKTLICPTCGCSLVRLGISTEKSIAHQHNGKELHFCCQGCVDLFTTNPPKYLQETRDIIVCPSCLGEKPVKSSARLKINDQEVHFCRCPYCAEVFQKNPDYYIQRLEGTISNQGVLDHEDCCIRP